MSEDKTRRRNRIITACLECRRRRLKCDRHDPCSRCDSGGRDCVFLAPARNAAGKERLERFKQAERKQVTAITSDSQVSEDEKDLEPTPLAFLDITYDDEGGDIVDDLGVQFGRMRITERLAGYARPRLAVEVRSLLQFIQD